MPKPLPASVQLTSPISTKTIVAFPATLLGIRLSWLVWPVKTDLFGIKPLNHVHALLKTLTRTRLDLVLPVPLLTSGII
jgi:hypothetical protein